MASFKVKNVSAGVFPITGERGVIMLVPGKVVDLSTICSPAFIQNSVEIQRLLKNEAIIRVGFTPPKKPAKPQPHPALKKKAKPAPKPKKAPPVKKPAPKPVAAPLPPPPPPPPVKEELKYVSPEVEEPAEEEIEDITEPEESGHTEEELEEMSFNELRSLAAEMGIYTYRKTKVELIEEILEKE